MATTRIKLDVSDLSIRCFPSVSYLLFSALETPTIQDLQAKIIDRVHACLESHSADRFPPQSVTSLWLNGVWLPACEDSKVVRDEDTIKYSYDSRIT